MQRILDRLLGSRHAQRLRSDAWPLEHIVQHGTPNRLPPEMVSGVLSNVERLSDDYRGNLTVTRTTGDRERAFQVEGGSALDYFLAGLTVIFEDVTVPSILPWKTNLERDIGIPAGICRLVGFASPKGRRSGLRPHWDAKEGLLIQIRGRKRIRVGRNHHVEMPSLGYTPGETFSEELATEFPGALPAPPGRGEDVELRPGSVIYLPRGYWHTTEALDDSFAVAVDFAWPTIADLVLPRIKLHLLRDAAWRRPLYGAWRSSATFERTCAELARTLEELPKQMADLVPREILAGVDDLDTRFRFLSPETEFVGLGANWLFGKLSGGSRDLQLTWPGRYASTTIAVRPKYVAPCEWVLRRKVRFTMAGLNDRFPSLGRAAARRILRALLETNAIQFAGKRQRARVTARDG